MPDQTSRQKRRSCLICGRPFVPSDETSDACDECRTLEPQHAQQRSAEPATMAAAGKSSSREGTPTIPPATFLPAKTRWHSAPFVTKAAEAKLPDRPRRPTLLWRLLMLVRYNFEAAAFIVVMIGVLWVIRYGFPKSFRLPGRNFFARQPATAQPDAAEQARNAANRQKKNVNLREGPQNWRSGDGKR